MTYLGHSQGTTQLLVGLIEKPEFFASKINLAIFMAPVARVDRMTSSTLHNIKDSDKIVQVLQMQGPELFPKSQVQNAFDSVVIQHTGFGKLQSLLLTDTDHSLLSPHGCDAFHGHFPSGGSLKSLMHFRQLFRAQKFQKYDYGSPSANLSRYH